MVARGLKRKPFPDDEVLSEHSFYDLMTLNLLEIVI